MKKHLWDILFYAVIFGMVYYQSSHDSDWLLMGSVTVFLIGAAQVLSTFFTILLYGLVWFWDATVNYSKNRKVYESEE
jgi:hypothetical protein